MQHNNTDSEKNIFSSFLLRWYFSTLMPSKYLLDKPVHNITINQLSTKYVRQKFLFDKNILALQLQPAPDNAKPFISYWNLHKGYLTIFIKIFWHSYCHPLFWSSDQRPIDRYSFVENTLPAILVRNNPISCYCLHLIWVTMPDRSRHIYLHKDTSLTLLETCF